MKMRPLLCLLAMQASMTAIAGNGAPPVKFDINGVQTGQPVKAVKNKWPGLECSVSCSVDGMHYLGAPGRFWASIKDGKIDQLAFGFNPAVAGSERERIKAFIHEKYGPPNRNLGFAECNEWDIDGGFLAVCLMDEASHVFWSHESRKDINASP